MRRLTVFIGLLLLWSSIAYAGELPSCQEFEAGSLSRLECERQRQTREGPPAASAAAPSPEHPALTQQFDEMIRQMEDSLSFTHPADLYLTAFLNPAADPTALSEALANSVYPIVMRHPQVTHVSVHAVLAPKFPQGKFGDTAVGPPSPDIGSMFLIIRVEAHPHPAPPGTLEMGSINLSSDSVGKLRGYADANAYSQDHRSTYARLIKSLDRSHLITGVQTVGSQPTPATSVLQPAPASQPLPPYSCIPVPGLIPIQLGDPGVYAPVYVNPNYSSPPPPCPRVRGEPGAVVGMGSGIEAGNTGAPAGNIQVRCERNGAVGSPAWMQCQHVLQQQIDRTAVPTHPGYSYTPAPGYYQYTVYSVAEPPRLCTIYMRPDPRQNYQPSIDDWKALPTDRCKDAIWKEPTNRHPDIILPTNVPR